MEKPSLIEKLAVDGAVPERLLGIFVKEPVAGKVKTRLCPPLNQSESARLYAVAMRETVERFTNGGLPVVLFYSGAVQYFEKKYPGLPLRPQQGDDLGERMRSAIDLLLATGCQAAALIGSDSPDLPQEQVEAAFVALDKNDAVTIPASDGGYVLVGCSRPCTALFEGIDWSTGAVCWQTRQRASESAIRYTETGGWKDIDDIDALRELLKRTPDSATARFARQELAHHLENSR